MYMLPVFMAWFSRDDNAIRYCTSGFVDNDMLAHNGGPNRVYTQSDSPEGSTEGEL